MPLKVVIREEIIIEDPSKEMLDYIHTNLITDNPEYDSRKRMGLWLGGVDPYILFYRETVTKDHNYVTVPFGCLKLLKPFLTKDTQFHSVLAGGQSVSYDGVDLSLYDYQKEAVDRMLAPAGGILKDGALMSKGGILIGKCGCGKTQIGLGLIVKLKKKALWITHTLDLLEQAYQRAASFMNPDTLGRIASGKVEIGSHITFATVQSLKAADLERLRYEWDVIVVDECHRICGGKSKTQMFFEVLSSLAAPYRFGLTATLHRSDGLAESARFALGDVLHEIPEGMLERHLTKPCVRVIDTDLAPDQSYMDKGEVNFAKLLSYITGNEARNKMIAEEIDWNRHRSCLVLSDRISQLRLLISILPEKTQEKCCIIDGSMQTKKGKQIRRDALQEMRDGSKNILFATYSLAREGIDIPRLDRLFLASPKKDCAVLKQSLGRISRSFSGKKDAICYDYADRRIGICIGLYKHRLNTYQKMGITIRSGGVDTSTVDKADNSALSRLFPSPASCFIPEPEKPLHTPGYPAAV